MEKLCALLHHSSFLLCNLTSTAVTQGKLSSQGSPVTPNYHIERLLLSPSFHAECETVDTPWTLLNSPSFINFSFQGFVALLSPGVPRHLFKIAFTISLSFSTSQMKAFPYILFLESCFLSLQRVPQSLHSLREFNSEA